MICKTCNGENEAGSKFCAICGAPFLQDEVEKNSEEIKTEEIKEATDANTNASDNADVNANAEKQAINGNNNSELNTTVLTAEMNSASEPSFGFVDKDAPVNAPMMNNNWNVAQASGMNNVGYPDNTYPYNSGVMMNDTGSLNNTNSLSQTEVLDKNINSVYNVSAGKVKGGSKAPFIVSTIALLLVAGGLGFGCFHFNSKAKDLEKQNKEITQAKEAAETKNQSLQGQVTSLQEQVDSLQKTSDENSDAMSEYENKIANYEIKLNEAQKTIGEYAPFQQVINFSKEAKAYSFTDFFCSNNLIHLKAGEKTSVSALFIHDSGNVNCNVADPSVATCELEKEKDGNVLKLSVSGSKAGCTMITVGNDVNDEKVDIFVVVE